MATVPGTPGAQDLIASELRPTEANVLIAAGIMHEQGKFKVAGDVVPFTRKPLDLVGNDKALDDYKKMMTRDTLSRALGGTSNVTPLKPENK